MHNGNVTSFAYAHDGERIARMFGTSTVHYLGNDAELLVDQANPAGLLTTSFVPGLKRVAATTSWLTQDHLGSNRLETAMAGGAATASYNYAAFGNPAGAALDGKAYINERFGEPGE